MEETLDHTIVQLADDSVSEDELAPLAPDPSNALPKVGDRMGRFVVLSVLGAGAMGVVLAAYDPELDRKAALKLLKSVGTSRSGRARLRREAQALARLNHVNVVTVHDVGVHEGRVFVAMEFVKGQTLREWMEVESEPRAWREVLRVFAAAGRGLAAAHGQGLIHRDFKPDNVMLGDDGRVRVMDFGLARFGENETGEVTEPDGAEPDGAEASGGAGSSLESSGMARSAASRSLKLTRTGTQLGTPAYMAPEQFKSKADALSDQFGFCASLYEALYGRRPFHGDTLAALVRCVMRGEVQPPPSSAKVPSWVAKVVLRGLSREPEQRYPSMAALLEALASDPRQRYRRAGAAVAIAGAFAGAVWLGGALGGAGQGAPATPCANMEAELGGSWDAARRSEVQEAIETTQLSYAASTWTRVAQGLDDYTGAWVEARVEACEATQAGTQSGELLDRRMSCLDARLAQVGALVDELAGAEAATVEKAAQAVSALPSLAPCADLEGLMSARPDPPEGARETAQVETFTTQLRLIRAKASLANYAQALELADTLAVEVEALGYEPLLVEVWLARGHLQNNSGRYDEAYELLERAYTLALHHRMWPEALRAAAELMGLSSRELQSPADAERWAALGEALHRVVGTERAREGFLLRLGRRHQFEGNYAEARVAFEAAHALAARNHGPGHISVANALAALAGQHINEGDFAAAQALLEQVIEIRRAELGPGHPNVADTLANLGIVAFRGGDYAGARAKLEQARVIFERAMGPESFKVSRILDSLGSVALLEGDYPSARDYYERAQVIIEALLGPEHLQMAALIGNLGEVARNEGHFQEACARQERARELYIAASGPDHPALLLIQTELGKARLGLGELAAARVELERALELAQLHDADALSLADLNFHLAQALWAQGTRGDRERARMLVADAREVLLDAGDAASVALAELDAWSARELAG